MAGTTSSDLQARIAELEAENVRLRETADLSAAVVPPAASATKPRRGRGRTAAAIVLVLIGLLLAPVAVVSAWARLQLVDTDRFVATFAPLAEDADVQAFLADEVTAAIEEQVDIPGLTSDVFDGILSLDLPPRAEQALGLLEAPAAEGLSSLVSTAVDRVIASPAFADVWATTLRVSHTQLIAAIQGDPDALLAIGSDGTLSVELGPIVEAVKERLSENGVGFASAIPVIERSVVIAQEDSLVLLQTVYTLAVAAGTWLPWLVLALLAAGVVVAKRRSVALTWAAGGLAAVMLLTLAGFGTGQLFFVAAVSPSIMSAAAAESIFGGLTALMLSTITAITVLAIAVALIAWLSGGSRPARAVRGFADSGFGAIRRSAEAQGITTGRFGVGLDRYRVLAYAAIAVIASLVLLFNRPLETSTVVWTVVLALVAVLLVELLRRPGVAAETAEGGLALEPGPVGAEAVAAAESRPVGAGTGATAVYPADPARPGV